MRGRNFHAGVRPQPEPEHFWGQDGPSDFEQSPPRTLAQTICDEDKTRVLSAPATRLRVITLNCLAPSLVDSKYQSHDPRALDHSVREIATVEYIVQERADLVGLQEVEPKQFTRFLAGLKEHGYDGVYEPHTGLRYDGVCLLWKESRFRLLEADGVNYKPVDQQDGRLRGQIVALELIEDPQQRVVISNCHLIFNFNKSAYKMAQILTLISQLYKWKLRYSRGFHREIRTMNGKSLEHIWSMPGARSPAVLMLGDFNLTPSSALYSWMVTGSVNKDIMDVARGVLHPGLLSGQAIMFNFPNNHGTIKFKPLFSPNSPKGIALGEAVKIWPMHVKDGITGELFARCRIDCDREATITGDISQAPETSSAQLSQPSITADSPIPDKAMAAPSMAGDSEAAHEPQAFTSSPRSKKASSRRFRDPSRATSGEATSPSCTAVLGRWLQSVCPDLDLECFVDTLRLDRGVSPYRRTRSAGPRETLPDRHVRSARKSLTPDISRAAEPGEIVEGDHDGQATLKRRSEHHPIAGKEFEDSDSDVPWDQVRQWLASDLRFRLPFPVVSAMEELRRDVETGKWVSTEPFATVHQGRQRGTVDYIFMEKHRFEVIRRTQMPTCSKIREMPELPNMAWKVSDHFGICVDLALAPCEVVPREEWVLVSPRSRLDGMEPAREQPVPRRFDSWQQPRSYKRRR